MRFTNAQRKNLLILMIYELMGYTILLGDSWDYNDKDVAITKLREGTEAIYVNGKRGNYKSITRGSTRKIGNGIFKKTITDFLKSQLTTGCDRYYRYYRLDIKMIMTYEGGLELYQEAMAEVQKKYLAEVESEKEAKREKIREEQRKLQEQLDAV